MVTRDKCMERIIAAPRPMENGHALDMGPTSKSTCCTTRLIGNPVRIIESGLEHDAKKKRVALDSPLFRAKMRAATHREFTFGQNSRLDWPNFGRPAICNPHPGSATEISHVGYRHYSRLIFD